MIELNKTVVGTVSYGKKSNLKKFDVTFNYNGMFEVEVGDCLVRADTIEGVNRGVENHFREKAKKQIQVYEIWAKSRTIGGFSLIEGQSLKLLQIIKEKLED